MKPPEPELSDLTAAPARWRAVLLIVVRRITDVGNREGTLKALERMRQGFLERLRTPAKRMTIRLTSNGWDLITDAAYKCGDDRLGLWLTSSRVNVQCGSAANPQLSELRREIEEREKTEGPIEDWRSFQEPETGPIDLQKSLF